MTTSAIARWFIASIFSMCSIAAFACTDFRLTATDGAVLITRTMEFSQDVNSNLRSSPRQRQFTMTTPDGKAGLAWQSKYGYLYLDGFNQDFTVDGMNEQGLSFEYLLLPGETRYQDIPAGQEDHALGYLHFGDWVLGNFKNVDQVREALKNIYVYQQTLPALGDVLFPVHAAIHDASGKSLVVEFVNGKMQVYDNKIGVMTNAPTFDWHLTNLRNYINLSPVTPKPIKAEGITFAATGQGAGMKGLPGDISPPSRFVKVAIMLQTVLPSANSSEALNMAQHIINNVDIPLGFVRMPENGAITNESTQWTIFKDLTHKIFYYRTYGDSSLRAVTLADIDFSAQAKPLKMPIAQDQSIEDMTEQFMKTNSAS